MNIYTYIYIFIYSYGAFSVPKYQPWNPHLASGSPDWYQHPPWFAEPNGWGTKPRSSAGLTELLRKCTGNSQETIRKPGFLQFKGFSHSFTGTKQKLWFKFMEIHPQTLTIFDTKKADMTVNKLVQLHIL
jgi:hypothetical protein